MAISDAEFLELKAQVEALEDESGADPSGSFSTIRDRLDSITGSVSAITVGASIPLSGDLSGTTDAAVVTKLQSFAVTSVAPLDTYVLTWNDSGSQWEPAPQITFTASGDLFGTSSSQQVIGLQGRALSNTAPTTGQFLAWNDGLSAWAPTDGGSGTFLAGGDLDGSDTSQLVVGLQSRPVNDTAPDNGDVLTWNGSAWAPSVAASGFTAGGDLSGTSSDQTVIAIQGVNVLVTAPTNGQALIYSNANTRWEPTTIPTQTATGAAGGDLFGTYPNPLIYKTYVISSGTMSNIGVDSNTALVIGHSQFLASASYTYNFRVIAANLSANNSTIELYDLTNAVSIETISITTTNYDPYVAAVSLTGSALYEVRIYSDGSPIVTDGIICTSATITATPV